MAVTKHRGGRLGEALLVAVLVVNFVCGASLLMRLRAGLTRELVLAERANISSRVNAYVAGKVLLFAQMAREFELSDRERRLPPEAVQLYKVPSLPEDWNFERVRFGTDAQLALYVGHPQHLEGQGVVLPLAHLLGAGESGDRFVVGTFRLSDLSGYLAELNHRGVLCRIVDRQGRPLLGEPEGFIRQEGGTDPWTEPVLVDRFAPEWRAQVSIPGVGRRLPLLPQALLSALVLLNAGFILYLRRRFLRPQQEALGSILNSLASRGEISRPERAAPEDVAVAVEDLLAREPEETPEELRRREEEWNRRCEELAQARDDLMAHHRLTKRMLQAREADQVYDTLLQGIEEAHGFHGALLGNVSTEGYLTFAAARDPVTGNPARIPLWNPASLLARAFWGGSSALMSSTIGLPQLPEERGLLVQGAEDGPVLLVPLMRQLKTRCAEVRNCGDRLCPYFFSEDRRCWLRHMPPDAFVPGAPPEIFREPLAHCLACEIFPTSALLLLRSASSGKQITRESVAPVQSLASEAALALEVVYIYKNMKVMAITDGLTGLFNHREFYHSLRRELERARRYQHPLSVLIIDVDDFKAFNDRYGHLAGDYALRKVADVIRRCARSTDIVARYGGEEFAVILPESVPKGALMVAERIKVEMGETNFIQNSSIFVHLTVSIGVYTSESGNISEDQMVSLADEAAYRAKTEGKNRVVVRVPR